MPKAIAFLLALLVLGPAADGARAMSTGIPAPGAACAIVLDGLGDESCWADAPVRTLAHERSPEPGRAPRVATRYRLLHDREHLYVLVECEDPDPQALRHVWSRRDRVGYDQDSVTLYIDPLGRRAFAQFFRVNPVGSLADGSYNEASLRESLDPDYEFDAATQVGPRGWTVEFRVPFTSLRYAGGSTASDWTMLVVRNYPREQRLVYTSTPLSENSDCFLCRNPALEQLQPPPDVRFLAAAPYVLVRHSTARPENPAPPPDGRIGADLKLRLGASSVLDATLNPDFSQVELDAPQLAANARFGLFFGEKRPFFLEGTDLIDTPLRLLHTRSIGDPRAGVRLTHRGERLEMLAIAAQDRGGSALMYPGTWNSRAIVRDIPARALIGHGRLALASGAAVGATASLRDSDDGDHNAVVGGDLAWQVDDAQKLRVQVAASHTRGDARARLEGRRDVDPGRGLAVFADHSYYGEHFDALLTVERIDGNFRAENGFIGQVGQLRSGADLQYRFGRVGWFHEVKPYLSVAESRALGGDTVYRNLHPALQLLGPGTGLLAELHMDQVRVDAGRSLHPLRQLLLSARLLPGARLTLAQLDVEIGRRLDYANDRTGPGLRTFGELRWRIGARLESAASASHERINVAGQRLLSETNAQLLATYTLDADSWLRLILQGSRSAQTLLDPTPARAAARRGVGSLVYACRPWGAFNLALGVSADRRHDDAGRARITEMFAKAAWPFRMGL